MHDPDPRTNLRYRTVTWRGLLGVYAVLAAIPVLLWAASAPAAAGLLLVGAATAGVATSHARRLAQCVRECKQLAVDLPGRVSFTVSWQDDCCTA